MSELLTCANCTYEIDEVSAQGYCNNCQNAYDLGKESLKINKENLERYLTDLSNSYAENSDYMRTKVESAYAQGVRQTVSHAFGLLNGSISVAYVRQGAN